ncbi:hypothetical protein PIB30_068711 [Stylosanthes scabra]|uniref:Uncharacterized protein n=1 Tax=Stylosanthes scabra TaxID=79078 RepID=A0ABU6VLJ8_9FABA|nr:hypothetical protein [Stylosanthes scabra]
MLGIHGDGEMRQFVAKLYNKIRPYFETARFLSNISGKTNESGGGLEDLQGMLLSEMGHELKSKIENTFKGAAEIKQRLGRKRVLLVLDDADRIQQLESLAAREDWFGAGNQVAEEDDVEEGDVVGFTNNSRFVIKLLCDANIEVVFIIGMGGLGKTTLAQKIYDDRQFSTLTYQNLPEKDIKKTVRNYLKGKKYLIVLDDIWEPEVWDDLKAAFPNQSNGSKILITSRNEEVANFTSSRTYKLPLLDENEGWELFCKKVFSAREIVESCGGLPLAIVAIAGVVRKKEMLESEWERVKECIDWHLTKDMTKVMDVLKLSYDSLSEELKPCFRYIGIYPEDFQIPARELIQLWMAEGFLGPQETGLPNAPEPVVVGKEYLKELVDRNMVHVAREMISKGKKCIIHDLSRDLCIILSKADKFFDVCTGPNIHTLSNPQRLSLLCSETSCISSTIWLEATTKREWNNNVESFKTLWSAFRYSSSMPIRGREISKLEKVGSNVE